MSGGADLYQPPHQITRNQPPPVFKYKDVFPTTTTIFTSSQTEVILSAMYKHSSPEALSLASLGRADSKRPDKTCRGITTAGKPCRKPLKNGAREKYCHLHRDQQTFSRSSLLGATRTVVEVDEEEDFYEHVDGRSVGNTSRFLPSGYPAPMTPSPSPPRQSSLSRRPVPSIRQFRRLHVFARKQPCHRRPRAPRSTDRPQRQRRSA